MNECFSPLGGVSRKFNLSNNGAPFRDNAAPAIEDVPLPSAPVTTIGPRGGLASKSFRRWTVAFRGKGPRAYFSKTGEAVRDSCVLTRMRRMARRCWKGLRRKMWLPPTMVADAKIPLREVIASPVASMMLGSWF